MRAKAAWSFLACAWLSAPACALRPITPPAPEFPGNRLWLNSEELTLKRLYKKRVVLVAFINTASLNSMRTLPVLGAWWERYALKGLMVVGVHTPDFDFDRDPLFIRDALRRFGVRFPVVVDEDMGIWKAYRNEGWPALYLIDRKGRVVWDRLGEGHYAEFEDQIREALYDLNGYEAPASLKLAADPPTQDCRTATQASYFGARRGTPLNLNTYKELSRELLSSRDAETAFKGKWAVEPNDIRLSFDNPSLSAFARVIYHGAEALAILGRGTRPQRVFLKQDDQWLHAGNAGPDVQWDEEDRSFVAVGATRPYYLTKNDAAEIHELTVMPENEGGTVFGFEFSDFCQTQYPHK